MDKYEWWLFVILEDGGVMRLTPDEPFIGTFLEAGAEAERLAEDLDGVDEFVFERRASQWHPSLEDSYNEDEYALTYDELKTNYEWVLNAKRTDDEIWKCVEGLYEARASGNFLETENALEDLMSVWERMLG